MKNVLCKGVLMACMLGACTNETVPEIDEAKENDLAPIVLDLKMSFANVEGIRGCGTVGGSSEETNVWRYENLYVLMTTSDKSALEENSDAEWGFTSVKGSFLKQQFNNTFYARPTQVERDGAKIWTIDYKCDPNEGGNEKYYPAQGRSDFFAYYVDDASQKDAKGNPKYVMEDNAISVAFEIDGSQDLLAGKADVSVTGAEQGFSAKTARANIIPSIRMKHMLTRLTFTLKNGNLNTSNVTVKSISVESPCKGKMYVAYQNEPLQNVDWEEGTKRLYLKQAMTPSDPGYFMSSFEKGKCPLTDFTPITMDGINNIEAGEALFITPGKSKYTMYIEMDHAITVGGAPATEPVIIPLELRLGNDMVVFEAGKSYHVNATIYGLEAVQLDTKLEMWDEYGEPIEVGNDNF